MSNALRLVLDSGAFSAWTRRESLDLSAYIKFCHRHADGVYIPVNLDVIPGAWGVRPTQAMVEASAKQGWENALRMRKEGVECLPVYHMGESREWLDRYIEAGWQYVGIAPINNRPVKIKMKWLDEVFEYLCGEKGYPEVKTHGFGVTALPVMFRYPWASVDSVTWQLMPGYGWLLVPYPHGLNGGYDYGRSPFQVGITDDTESRDPNSATIVNHIKNMGPASQQYVKEYLASEGMTIKQVATDAAARVRITARFFKKAAEANPPRPFKNTKPNFGLHTTKHRPGSAVAVNKRLRFVFSTAPSANSNVMLTEEGCRDRLISYYPLINRPDFPVQRYAATGLPIKTPRKPKKEKV